MEMDVSAIFIRPASAVDDQKLLDLFGYGNTVQSETSQITPQTFFPAKNTLHLIRYRDAVMICVLDFPTQFCDSTPSYMENKLVEFFPDSEIFAATINRAGEYVSYALVQRGERKRVYLYLKQYGFEVGQTLPEELITQNLPDIVYAIAGNFIGGPLNRNDDFMKAGVKSYTLAPEYSDEDEYKTVRPSDFKAFPDKVRKFIPLIAIIIILVFMLIRFFIS